MGPGDAQWMRAGSGIIHDEGADAAFQAKGGVYHGVQLWLTMPNGRRGEAPAYRQIGRRRDARLRHRRRQREADRRRAFGAHRPAGNLDPSPSSPT